MRDENLTGVQIPLPPPGPRSSTDRAPASGVGDTCSIHAGGTNKIKALRIGTLPRNGLFEVHCNQTVIVGNFFLDIPVLLQRGFLQVPLARNVVPGEDDLCLVVGYLGSSDY